MNIVIKFDYDRMKSVVVVVVGGFYCDCEWKFIS